MRETTIDAAGPIEHQPAVTPGPEEDGKTHRSAPGRRRPPPSDSPPSTPCSGQTPRWTNAEPGRASNARQSENQERKVDAFELKSSRATVLPTCNRIDVQTADSKRSTPSPSRQARHQSQAPRIPSGSRTSCRDVEKASGGRQSPRSPHSAFASGHHTTTVYTVYDETDEEDDPKQHALWILIYLSALAPLLSIITCLYALTATILVLGLSPLCWCVTAHPINANFPRFLALPLRFQLGLIYSDFDPEESSSSSSSSSSSNPAMLVLVNLLAPVYAIGICVAAWVAAGFWFFAAILGDPNLKNKTAADKDDDGKTAVMSVRRWWEKWLISGLR